MLISNFDPNECFPKMTEDLVSYINSRDNGLCILGRPGCQCSGSEPHHVIYRSHGGKNCANNLALLCQACHSTIHTKSDGVKELLLDRIKNNEKRLRGNLI